MKRNTTVLVLCGLLLIADLIWLRLLLDGRESLLSIRAAVGFVSQVLVTTTLVGIVYLVLRKKYARQKKPASRQEAFGLLQPLRRLFAAVLS